MASNRPSASRPFLPLKGIRVLAFEVAYSLPAGTRTLAELGAEVVRVCGPGRDSFYIGVVDGVYLSKRCIGIHLKDPDGLAVAKQLAAKADVICSNFVPGVMERLGLGYEELKELNPQAIVLQLSGYGSPGPWSGYAAFGPSTEAAGGMNQLVGPPDGPPIRLGSGVFSDQLGGRFAALGIIAALEERQRTGQGKFIDLSMAEAISLLVGHTVAAAAAVGEAPGKLGNRDRDFAPQGVYRAKGEDEWVAITVRSDGEWRRFVALTPQPPLPTLRERGSDDAALEDPRFETALTPSPSPDSFVAGEGSQGELPFAGLNEPHFATVEGRHAGHDEIDAAITAWTETREKFEVEALLQAAGIPCAAVVRSRDPLFDKHLWERGLWQWVEHARPILGFGAHPHPTTPWFASGHERHRLTDIHFHGADNVGVFREWLGMEETRVRALEESGALIVIKEPVVEDRRTGYRDEDWAEELGLNEHLGARDGPHPQPLSRLLRRGRGERDGTPLRVLEVSQGPAGAFAGMLLARLGHEVTKFAPPALPNWKQTARLNNLERDFLDSGKRSETVVPGAWNEEVLRLTRDADAVIEDFGRGIGSYGFSSHRVRDTSRNAVTASISPYGQTGPKSRWAGSELTIQASAGVLHSTGWIGEAPQKAGGFAAHYIAGIHAATAVLARAYGVRAGNCAGGRIEVSMQETYLHHWSRHIGEWAYSGTKMKRERPGFGHQGFRHTAMAADGWLYVLSLYATWEEIALFFGLTDFLGSEWSSAEYRMEHWREIEGPYLRIVASKARYEWFRLAAEAGYTFAPVHAAADQFENPQFAARGFLKDATIGGTTVLVPGLPFPWAPVP